MQCALAVSLCRRKWTAFDAATAVIAVDTHAVPGLEPDLRLALGAYDVATLTNTRLSESEAVLALGTLSNQRVGRIDLAISVRWWSRGKSYGAGRYFAHASTH